jgi:hypothetical protein
MYWIGLGRRRAFIAVYNVGRSAGKTVAATARSVALNMSRKSK